MKQVLARAAMTFCIACALLVCVCEVWASVVILRESFETPTVIANRKMYDMSRAWKTDVTRGCLTLYYSSAQDSLPSGLECSLPTTDDEVQEREMQLNFMGGGSEMSNSLFVAYAVGPGKGLSLPTLPSGNVPNDRTGYIVRFIRHGDGTNEVKFYRNDAGWVKELQNAWLSSNPITTLRKIAIRHTKQGRHVITALFDTGSLIEHRFGFEDSAYPPGKAHRGLQVIAKGHAYRIENPLYIVTDTWLVTDFLSTKQDGKVPRSARFEDTGAPPQIRISDVPRLLETASYAFKRRDFKTTRHHCLTILRADSSNVNALYLLGHAEMELADMIGANMHLTQAHNILGRQAKPDQALLADVLNALGTLYKDKDPHKAETFYLRSIGLRESIPIASGLNLAGYLHELATFYVAQKRLSDAEPVFRRAINIIEGKGGPLLPDLDRSLFGLARLYHARKQYDRAEPVYRRSLGIREKHFGSAHSEVATVLDALAEIYRAQRRINEEGPLVKRWLEIMGKELGTSHPEYAKRLNYLATFYINTGRASDAIPLLQESLATREKLLGPNHIEVAESLNNLGVVYMRYGRLREAEPLLKRSLEIRERAFGQNHPILLNALDNLTLLCNQMGHKLIADSYASRAALIRRIAKK